MSFNEIGISHKQIFNFFNQVINHTKGMDGFRFKSKTYPTLEILNHKGYIYVWERDNAQCLNYQNLNIDGFRCMESRNLTREPGEMYFEIHASGGDSNIANPDSLDYELPNNVVAFFLDCLKPNFVSNDIFK